MKIWKNLRVKKTDVVFHIFCEKNENFEEHLWEIKNFDNFFFLNWLKNLIFIFCRIFFWKLLISTDTFE